MSSNNPRGKQRKNGNMQEYTTSSVQGPVPPASSTPQLMTNSTSSASISTQQANSAVQSQSSTQPQPNNLGFIMPTVDTATHPNHLPQSAYRNNPRNLSNPTMQFAPGEVHVERPQQGITTIHPRYMQQTQQTFSQTAQMANYTTAPPMSYPANVYSNVYSAQNAYPFQQQTTYYQANTPAAIPHFTQYYASAIPAGTAGGTNVSVGGVQDYMVGGRYSAATAGGNSAAAAQQLLQFSAATPQTAMAAQIQAYSTQQAAAAAACAAATQVPSSLAQVPTSQAAYSLYQPPQVTTPHPHSVSASLVGGAQPPQSAAQVAQLSSAAHAHHLQSGPAPSQSGTLQTSSSQQTPQQIQQSLVAAAAAAAAAQNQAHAAAAATHQKEKKILKIINPETQEVTNEREINAAAAAANLMGGASTGIVGGAMSANASSSSLNNSFGADGGEQMYSGGVGPVADYDGAMTMGAGAAQGGRRSAQLDMSNQQSNVITGMTTAQVTTTNASQKFSLQVAQSVLGDTNINNNNDINNKNNNNINNNKNVDSSKEDVHKEESISNDVRREQQNEEIDKNESNELKSEEAEVKPIEETAGKDEDEVDRKREKSAEPSPEIVREQERVPEKEIREESSPPKDEAKVEKEGEERSLVEGVESIDLNKEGNINEGDSVVMNNTDENVNKVIVNGNEPNANDGDQHKTATHHAVEVVLEETEKEEKATSEEEDETKIERKRREFENKQAEMLKDITNVSVEMMLYSRSYLMLMRDVVKELKLKTCPVEETELKSLGIDIGTAPVVNMDRQQRRLEGVSRAFAPGWMPDNKNPLRPKQYHGRLSDRGHSQRTDRDRKRGPISRPSIDRPAREPVKLHKSENAWKHEALSQLDKDQQLYKDIRGLLNKITPSTFDVLCAKFLGYKVYQNKEQMSEVIDIIFDKAVEEPKFCPLYSDLCKKQVIEESQESGKSEFRSGILTRCQQTFETKRQDEINKKREEAAAEKDEKRQKELKIEVMEMEAKERRRMFGNIGFIGQLFRHELIVPRILNWCIIHLLKNHSEAQAQGGSDEESIECAVRMLETVGKIAEKHGLSAPRADSTQGGGTAKGSATDSAVQQQTEFNLNLFFTHLNDIASNVSNRVRFLIMNLIELRNNEWNPRKSADSGPKTIEQVHNEARKEDLMNKLQREQYEKKRGPYEGRASLDRRGMGASSGRPTIIGRQSQDGRYSARGGGGLSSVSSAPGLTQSQIENQKARAAVAANLVVSTASRKNQSLNSVDQPQSLGGGRRQFACGSAGGGQQDRDRALQQGLGGGGPAPSGQSSSSGRLSSRGSYAHRNALTYQAQHHTSMQHSSSNSRDNSQPSSREHSQSRKHSAIIDEERVSALTAASVMTHSSGGSRQRGSVGGGHNAATTNRMRSESPSSTTVGGSQNTSHPHHHHQMNSGSVQNHDELQPQHKSGDMQLQEDGEDPTAILHQQQQQQTEAALKNEKRALSILAEDLGEYFADGADIEQIYANVMEVCQTMSVRSVFRLIMTIGVEKVTGGVTNPHRRYVGQIICRCLQSSENVKQEALHGIADYCNYVVESELWEDNMRIWEFVAEIIGWSIMCDTKHFEGARPWLGDFREAFKMANGDTRQVDALFFYCIKKITEIELDRESHATSASMAYADLKELHTDALTSLLKNCKLANGDNLSELLLS